MKKRLRIIFFFLSFVFTASLPGEVVDRVVAVVGEDVITASELEELLAPLASQYRVTYEGEELEKALAAARGELLNELIEEKLILQEAERREISCSREEVEERLTRIRGNFSSPEEFQQALAAQGITEEKLREKTGQQIMLERVVEYEVKQKIIISPQEISDYYGAHKENFLEPEEVRLRIILIKEENIEKFPEAKVRAQEVSRRLGEGEDFAGVAREYSQHSSAIDGGDLGFVGRGQMLAEIDRVIFDLPVGKISEPIEIKAEDWWGFYICRVEERKPERLKGLSEIQSLIRKAIFQEKFEQRFAAWLEKLKKGAYISIR